MSGGRFDYNQYQGEYIAVDIEKLIESNNTINNYNNYSAEVIEKFKEAAYNLRRAAEMAQRVDWLVSGDDSEETFFQRWQKEVRPPYDP